MRSNHQRTGIQPPQRILVVDDDTDICANMQDILSEFGYDVVTANDGEEALTQLRSTTFDLALLDLRLPGMDGLTLFREMKSISPETATLLVTAYAAEETVKQANEAGMLQVLSKPVDVSRLLPLIDEVLDQPLLLVVDDDPDLCANLRDILNDSSYRVSVAGDVDEAMRKLTQSAWQIMVVDTLLPGRSGLEIVREVAQTMPDARVLVMTGLDDDEGRLVQEVQQAGAKGLCRKPLDIPELLLKISELMPCN